MYDLEGKNSLSLNELAVLLQEIGNKVTALPAVREISVDLFTVKTDKFCRPPKWHHSKGNT
jgi:hypothetical protein